MISDSLINNLAATLVSGTFTPASHVAFTSTEVSFDPSSNELSGEFDRVSATGSNVLGITTFTGVRTGALASSTGDRVNAIALFNSSSGGQVYSVVLVPSVLHTTDFDFEVEWIQEVSD